VAGSRQHGNELPDFIKGAEFLNGKATVISQVTWI
jgi:hypothetical protein